MGRSKSWAIGKQRRTKIRNENKYYETYPTFGDISNSNKLKTPRCQAELNENKVTEMIQEYKKDKYKFKMKDTIIIGVLHDMPFLVDGQHRIEMAKRLIKDKSLSNYDIELEDFRFCYYIVNNQKELRELFNSVNKDSIKNEWWINTDEQTQVSIDQFKMHIKKKFNNKGTFPRSKHQYKYTLNEICQLCKKHNLFNNTNPNTLANDIIKKNDDLIQKYYTNYNETKYYSEDNKCIKNNKNLFLLKNINFFDYFAKDEPLYHKEKLKKKSIPKILKDKCWELTYENKDAVICPIPHCGKQLNKYDTSTWHAGHIISECNGGKTEINNLRPICKDCNLSMGKKNWNDYINIIPKTPT